MFPSEAYNFKLKFSQRNDKSEDGTKSPWYERYEKSTEGTKSPWYESPWYEKSTNGTKRLWYEKSGIPPRVFVSAGIRATAYVVPSIHQLKTAWCVHVILVQAYYVDKAH